MKYYYKDYEKDVQAFQVAEAKAHFSTIIQDVEDGNEVAIAYGKKKQKVAVIVPYDKWAESQKRHKRQLGTLEGKMSVSFAEDFKMSDEEFLNS